MAGLTAVSSLYDSFKLHWSNFYVWVISVEHSTKWWSGTIRMTDSCSCLTLFRRDGKRWSDWKPPWPWGMCKCRWRALRCSENPQQQVLHYLQHYCRLDLDLPGVSNNGEVVCSHQHMIRVQGSLWDGESRPLPEFRGGSCVGFLLKATHQEGCIFHCGLGCSMVMGGLVL